MDVNVSHMKCLMFSILWNDPCQIITIYIIFYFFLWIFLKCHSNLRRKTQQSICNILTRNCFFLCTVKLVNKGHKNWKTEHSLYRQVVFIWRLYCFYLINQGILKCDLYLQDGLYSEVGFNTGLTLLVKSNQDKGIKRIFCQFYILS